MKKDNSYSTSNKDCNIDKKDYITDISKEEKEKIMARDLKLDRLYEKDKSKQEYNFVGNEYNWVSSNEQKEKVKEIEEVLGNSSKDERKNKN